VVAGTVVAGTADTTAVDGTGTQDTIAGTAVGAGGAVVGTRGGLFRCLTLIRITEGTVMVQVMGTGTEEDTDLDWRRFPVNLFLFPVLSFHPYTIDA
jgi:hypothetical protein